MISTANHTLKRFLPAIFCAVSVLFAASACSGKQDQGKVNVSIYHASDVRAAECDHEFSDPLVICTENASGDNLPNTQVWVKAKKGSQLFFSPDNGNAQDFRTEISAQTDAAGELHLRVKAGKITGDQYADVYTAQRPDVPVKTVRFIAGMTISGVKQEAPAGNTIKEPFTVRLTDPNGQPVPGTEVTFSLKNPFTGQCETDEVQMQTDQNGEVFIQPRLGTRTGKYMLSVGIHRGDIDTFDVPMMSLNLSRLLINVLGGLAIFIFGMKMMSDGLHIAAGEKMKTLLHFFSSNHVVAILAGTLVTTVLQSSSASTVMVIGFVNAGLLSLEQSIGIIFGANIGKAVVTQLVAFNMSGVIMPCIIMGLMLLLLSWQRFRGWGETLLGFGFLFMGMGMMSSEMKPLGEFPSFIEFFQTFQCFPQGGGTVPFWPLIGAIGIGILVTIIVQSSFPTTSIVIALCGSGLLDIYASIAIVLGANIGTTITAQLASIPANRVAKQAALAHTMFNVLGVLIVLPFFWIKWPGTGKPLFPQLVAWLTPGDIFAEVPQNIPHYIVNAHMYFNVLTTIILFFLIPLLAKLCTRVIPVGEKKVKFTSLEPHLLDTPALALEQTGMALRKMLKKAWKMIDTASVKCFIPNVVDTDLFESLAKKEEKIDAMQVEITSYLTQIMRRTLNKNQTHEIPQ